MKKSDGPGRGDVVGEILHVVERDEHDGRRRMTMGESLGGFEAVHLRHVDVHQNEIRALVIGVPERLCAGCGIGDRPECSGRIYHGSGDPAKSRLVIDDHDSNASTCAMPGRCSGLARAAAPLLFVLMDCGSDSARACVTPVRAAMPAPPLIAPFETAHQEASRAALVARSAA
jgi:hypothetical protein